MIQEQTHLMRILETDSGIDAGYRHYPKRVTPGDPLSLEGAVLKWYDLHAEDRPVPDEIASLARNHLKTTELEALGLGFVVSTAVERIFTF